MPSVNDLKRSRFLTQKDIDRPILATIRQYEEMNVAKEGAEPDERWVVWFREIEKPMVLNSTNGQIIARITGSEELNDSVGTKVVLYVDENISFGGKLVGGIRIRAPKSSSINKPIPEPAPEDEMQHLANEIQDDGVPF